MDLAHPILAVLAGVLVGFTLGLIGSGGSIIATPLLLYVVGLQPHVAIGTSALAVSANAFVNFGGYARAGNVRWRSAVEFAVVGIVGAAVGSTLGKTVDGQRLLFLFAILMAVVGALMLRRDSDRTSASGLEAATTARYGDLLVIGTALGVGGLSGFFGVGGGFLIVPGLLFSTGAPMICAVGSSLLAVGAFGLVTAVNYGMSGLIDWGVAAECISGGVLGGFLGMWLGVHLALRNRALKRIFGIVVLVTAGYMLYRNAAALGL